MRDDYELKMLRQEMQALREDNDYLRSRVALLEKHYAEDSKAFVTLCDSVAQLWERVGPVLDQMFPNLARTEAEVYRVLGVKRGDIPNHEADRKRDTE